jgi:hypothetical protein
MNDSSQSLDVLKSLEHMHQHLNTKVEELFASLNIQQSFNKLKGIELDYIQTLLLAHDLKINIRKCAIGSFFEWDRLDQAVGGCEVTLGKSIYCSNEC